jgi:hypothetical protein
LILETPVGSSSALVRLRCDENHPALGAGLLATLQLPLHQSEAEAIDSSACLNFLESSIWTNVPQLGTWHPQDARDGEFRVATSSFYPNALYTPGVATNAALWQLGRARWAKEQLWPDLENLTMLEILKKRFGSLSELANGLIGF